MEVSSLLIKMSKNLPEQQFTINEQTKLHNKETNEVKLRDWKDLINYPEIRPKTGNLTKKKDFGH